MQQKNIMSNLPEVSNLPETITVGEVYLPADDLKAEMPFFLSQLGFRLEEIYPADDPAVAIISGYGIRIRLDRNDTNPPGRLRLRYKQPGKSLNGATELISPSGNRIEFADENPSLQIPETRHSYRVRHLRDSDSWVIGRAGMHYRDLIPDRLGGSIIASHIRIPNGGPVPDMVHYHKVGFQLIFCYRGWVRLVYEDQGEPFILYADDCVIQPPEIRHRVLEASDNVEVLEIGVPAEHITAIDHEMELPNNVINTERRWQGTRFVHYQAQETPWLPWRLPGWKSRNTGIGEATGGIAGVHVSTLADSTGTLEDPVWSSHTADILFTFVKEGQMTLEVSDQTPSELKAGDAFVLPPYVKSRYLNCSADCELIEVALKSVFMTELGVSQNQHVSV